MREVGAFEAKTHLSALLEAAEAGETILITRRGTPVARLGPAGVTDAEGRRNAVRQIRGVRATVANLTPDDILSARDEGRR